MNAKTKKIVTVFLLSVGLLTGIFTLFQAGVRPVHATTVLPDIITVTVNIGADPPTLDPSYSGDTTSNTVIEQLFVGLVDIDDRTGDVKPELATGWTTSPDNRVYTLTLRNNVFWTDGYQVTAEDVRYAILRALDPNHSGMAYLLFPIANAEDYVNGVITDSTQVGVTVVDTTTLRFDFTYPLGYESFFSLTPTRPLPRWTIETWGDQWTDPVHIVTSGAYQLTEWEHDDHIQLDKNPNYYDATNVQINRVIMVMTDTEPAGQLYLNNQLDTTAIWDSIPPDVLASDAVRIYPIGCTQYYGFSVTQPPFDNVKVRQAFASAVDRQGLINTVLDGDGSPALTLTPPGAFGYVDGYTEDVGLPYNPTYAQQLLVDAGYPSGQGLPPVTLWYNTSTGLEAMAKYVQQGWYSTLGVSVTLQSLDWSEYLGQLNNGDFTVWRLGWCMDYPDAYNFLYDAVIPGKGRYGNWTNSNYENLLEQSSRTQDPDARKALFKQAEEILVETDAVMIPLYYYEARVVTKPYLNRTYPVGGRYDISEWRITTVQEVVDETGGGVSSDDGQTTVDFPPDAFTDTVNLTFSPAYATGLGDNVSNTGNAFEITATYSDTGEVVTTTTVSFTIAVTYASPARIATAYDEHLGLYYKDGDTWVYEPSTTVDAVNHVISAVTNRLGLWAVLQKDYTIYLPLVMR